MEKLGQLDPRLSVLDAEFDETALEAEAGQAAQQAAAAAIEALALRDQAAATTTRARCGAVWGGEGGKAVTGSWDRAMVWTSIWVNCHARAKPTTILSSPCTRDEEEDKREVERAKERQREKWREDPKWVPDDLLLCKSLVLVYHGSGL